MVKNTLNNDNVEEVYNRKQYLTGSFRIELLMSIYKSDKTVKELKKKFNKTENNILQYLKEFENEKVIEKYDNKYTLTSKGYLIVKTLDRLINNWNSINKNIDFIDNHCDSNMPLELIMNSSIWDNAELIRSSPLEYSNTINIYKDLINNSKYLKVILPIFSKVHVKIILESLDSNNGKLDVITSKFIIKLIQFSELGSLFSKLEENGQINIWYTSSHNILNKFLTCTENFASLFLFYEDGNCDDSQMLLIKDKKDIKKLDSLIEYNKLNF